LRFFIATRQFSLYNINSFGAAKMNTEETKVDVNLILFKKGGSRKSFPLPSNITVIGRRHDCDLCIPLMVVSRRHCQLSQNNEALKIRDLDSRGGTYLNGKRISEATVQAGDYLTIGPLTFMLQINGEPAKIVPPQQSKAPPAQKKSPAPKAPAADLSGSFPELELDDSDSLSAELKDI
jgi:predicted component of type VI protein secretion system